MCGGVGCDVDMVCEVIMDRIDQIKHDRACGIVKPLLQSDHWEVNRRYPGTTLEYCCECDNPTGRAGRAEDSIYAEYMMGGDEIGPLCWNCYDELVFAKIIKPEDE